MPRLQRSRVEKSTRLAKPADFLVKEGAGEHHHDDGFVYVPGETVTSDHALDVIFPNKFQKYKPELPKKKRPPGYQEPEVEEEETDDEAEKEEKSDAPEDVTEAFPKAKMADLTVEKVGKHYNVLACPEEGKEPVKLNDAPLKSKAAVNAFIEDQAKK